MSVPAARDHESVLRALREVNALKDVDAILDRVLQEARHLVGADAGSIFLAREGRLHFAYVQNDTLFREYAGNKACYQDFSLPIDPRSIVGFVATTGEALRVADAYALPEGASYQFDSSWDEYSGYLTRSILTLPLTGLRGEIIGVMQLINALDANGVAVEFDQDQAGLLPLFAFNAALAIERGQNTRELVLRMVKMAELRDPTETGAHVHRVGAFSAEIYQQWAVERGVSREELRHHKDLIRVAAMLHDVGKVGISDLILKKPGQLSEAEFAVMKWHPILGARLFLNNTSELDQMSMEIALNHHEKWDGGGYPGRVEDWHDERCRLGEGKRGEEIPLWARIVTLADVYDALASQRVYKRAWSEERILEYLREQAGSHFDPEVVAALMKVADLFPAIRQKYQDEVPVEGASIEAKIQG